MDYQAIADKLSSVGTIKIYMGTQQDATSHHDRWINCSGSSGSIHYDNVYIEIGIYQDEELRDISFFHELGHVMSEVDANSISMWHGKTCRDKFEVELAAWEKGFVLAEAHGIKLSAKVVSWAMEQLATYVKYSVECGKEYQ